MLPQILSCRAAVTNIWVSSCRLGCETSQFVKGMLSIHRLGWRARIERSQRKRRRCVAEGKTEREGDKEGKKTVSNPLKFFLNPLSSAQPGKQHFLRPPPERGLCNQSSLSVRQLVVHTGSQLGWKERERQSEGGRERARLSQWQWRGRILTEAKASVMISCCTDRQQHF